MAGQIVGAIIGGGAAALWLLGITSVLALCKAAARADAELENLKNLNSDRVFRDE